MCFEQIDAKHAHTIHVSTAQGSSEQSRIALSVPGVAIHSASGSLSNVLDRILYSDRIGFKRHGVDTEVWTRLSNRHARPSLHVHLQQECHFKRIAIPQYPPERDRRASEVLFGSSRSCGKINAMRRGAVSRKLGLPTNPSCRIPGFQKAARRKHFAADWRPIDHSSPTRHGSTSHHARHAHFDGSILRIAAHCLAVGSIRRVVADARERQWRNAEVLCETLGCHQPQLYL